jgi:integrase
MRISEILNLRTEDLDLDNKAGAVLTVTDAKTDAGARTVYLNRAAAKVLREQLLVRAPSGFVFPHRTGKQWDRFAFTKEYIRARRRAGHPDFNFHQLRHSAVSHLGEAGLRLEHVAAQVGWSPGSMAAMASRYRHVFDGELPERIRAMDEMRERAI